MPKLNASCPPIVEPGSRAAQRPQRDPPAVADRDKSTTASWRYQSPFRCNRGYERDGPRRTKAESELDNSAIPTQKVHYRMVRGCRAIAPNRSLENPFEVRRSRLARSGDFLRIKRDHAKYRQGRCAVEIPCSSTIQAAVGPSPGEEA